MKGYSLKVILSLNILIFLAIACSSSSGGSDVNKYLLTFGGSENDRFDLIINDTNGDFIIAGETGYFYGDAWILKLNPQGEIIWQTTYDSGGYDVARKIQVTPEGNYIAQGSTSYNDGNKNTYWVLTLDEQGEILWEKTFTSSIIDIQITTEGDYIVAGPADFDFGDVWILKLDEQGQALWEENYTVTGGFTDLKVTPDGGYIAAGVFPITSVDGAWVMRLDEQGEVIWEKSYGGEYNKSIYSLSILSCSESSYAITANCWEGTDEYVYMEQYLFKLKWDGQMIWQKKLTFESGDRSLDVCLTSDEGFLVIGENIDYISSRPFPWVAKLNENGELVWKINLTQQNNTLLLRSPFELSNHKSYMLAFLESNNSTELISILVISPEGNIICDNTIFLGENIYLEEIIANSRGGYILIGYYGSSSTEENPDANTNAFLLFLDEEGNSIDPEREF